MEISRCRPIKLCYPDRSEAPALNLISENWELIFQKTSPWKATGPTNNKSPEVVLILFVSASSSR
jgi:hypothetical protein